LAYSAVVGAVLVAGSALAQTTAPAPGHAAEPDPHRPANRANAPRLSELVVTSRADLMGKAITASQGSATTEELQLRPIYRVGQLLESIPGLVVTAHSGEAKANQYLLRGFNLDHGTDFADFVDDVPVNRPTNAHGQGYSDVNFIIPQMISGLDYTKGPYFASIGDFGVVASAHQHLFDDMPTQMTASAGTLGDDAVFAAGTAHFDDQDRLLVGLNYSHMDGPFTPPNDFQKIAGVARFSHDDASHAWSATAMYYKGEGNLATDQPVRAIEEGLIDRYGVLDPTDGARSERLAVSGHYGAWGDDWRFAANGYYVRSRQTLWNNFTHFLEDPVNGDQEQQDETRDLFGGAAALTLDSKLGESASRTTLGIQGRFDDIYVDRRHTKARRVLDYCTLLHADGTVTEYSVGLSACTADQVQLADVGLYVENTTEWTTWLRTDIGLREEFYQGWDHSLLTLFNYTQFEPLFQPKASIILGPWLSSEFYLSAGRGFHSDDIRGVSGTVPLEGLPTAAGTTPLLAVADGAEAGLRSNIIPKLKTQVSVFYVDLTSELVYDQDQGEDQAGAPSRRYGVEISAEFHPTAWMELDSDLAFSHARFNTNNLAAYGDSGDYIPNAPAFIGSFGALVDNLGNWFGGAEVRILGAYPLTPDNSQRDAGYSEVNLSAGYKFTKSLKAQIEIFNAFDVKANAGAYYYVSRLPGEPAQGVADHQIHPLEPISARLSLMATF
jgi:outer membrane receptor protein involved in Fe transport